MFLVVNQHQLNATVLTRQAILDYMQHATANLTSYVYSFNSETRIFGGNHTCLPAWNRMVYILIHAKEYRYMD